MSSYYSLAKIITDSLCIEKQYIINLLSNTIEILFKRDDIIDFENKEIYFNFDLIGNIVYIDDEYQINNKDIINIIYKYCYLYLDSLFIERFFYDSFDIIKFFEIKISNSGIGITSSLILLDYKINLKGFKEVINVYGIYISLINDILSIKKEKDEIKPFNMLYILVNYGVSAKNAIQIISYILKYCSDVIEQLHLIYPDLCRVCDAICNGYAEWSSTSSRYK